MPHRIQHTDGFLGAHVGRRYAKPEPAPAPAGLDPAKVEDAEPMEGKPADR